MKNLIETFYMSKESFFLLVPFYLPFLPSFLFFPLFSSLSPFLPLFSPSFLLFFPIPSSFHPPPTLSSLIWGRWYLTLSKEIIFLFQNPYAFTTQSTELEEEWILMVFFFFPSESRTILQVSSYFQTVLQQPPIFHTVVCIISWEGSLS